MSIFEDFMIEEAVKKGAEERRLHALNVELLKSLKQISEIELAAGPGLSTWHDFAEKCIDIARAAIAKAEGQ